MMENYTPRIRICEGRWEIFDPIRKKFVALTPEEAVRQQMIHFLLAVKKFPEGLLQVEAALSYNSRSYRADIVGYNRRGNPLIIVECKAAEVEITQGIFEQIARYNLVLKVPYLLVSNGRQHFFCRLNAEQNTYVFEDTMPDYSEL